MRNGRRKSRPAPTRRSPTGRRCSLRRDSVSRVSACPMQSRVSSVRFQVSRITHHALRFTLLLALTALLALPTAPRHVTLALLGDIMLGRGVTPTEETFAYLHPYLSTADLALANLESPLSSNPPDLQPSTFDFRPSNLQPSTFNLCAPPERVRFPAAAGLDMLSLENNHRLDCGEAGLVETKSRLVSAGITPLGPQPLPVYRTVNGLKLAFLAFEDVSAPLDVDMATQAIGEARAGGALVIVSIHWGMEYQGGASERQKRLAAQFAQAGAALIWGHHPHVIQPAEWIQPPAGSAPSSPPQGKPAGGSTLVLYSLGNALFDQGGLADTRRSALVLVELDENGVRSARAVPFEIDIQHSRVQAADNQVAQAILEHLNLK
ncbi:MAG: hypothetical protein C0393_07585 [Anaerolinea sp.]|nr:hypothetical protein [Anaerolinea sp.]